MKPYKNLKVPEVSEGFLEMMKRLKGKLRQEDYCTAARKVIGSGDDVCPNIQTCTECLFVDRLDNEIFNDWRAEYEK
jgi:hypothetical protein